MKSYIAIVLLALLSSPVVAQAEDVTVSNSPKVGMLPHIVATFVISDDVLPIGSSDLNVFALFDTGSDRVRFSANTAARLGVTTNLVLMNVRINGISALDPASLNTPVYSGPAQAELPGITTTFESPMPNRTLLGGPVTEAVKAVINYTKTVTRGPYLDDPDGEIFEAPDITFYPSGIEVGFTPAITLNLQPLSPVTPPLTAKGKRYLMYAVSFNEGPASVASLASGNTNVDGIRFMFDTGTTVTEIDADLATALGLDPTAPDYWQPMSSGTDLPGFYLDSITMTGAGSTYTVLDAPVVVVSDLHGPNAVIGSNLFSHAKLLWDGPNATLGISVPSANNPPVADAGDDQVIEATGTTTPFTLDGTGSSDPDDDTLTYSWKDEYGFVVGTDATVTLSRELGPYMFTLTVTDTGDLTAEDTVFVTIRDTTPPSLNAPPDITVPEGDPLGTAVNLGQATASDICDPAPSVGNNAPVLLPLGETMVTWTATDASGNSSTAPQKVTVVPGTPLNQLSNLAKLINHSVASGGIASELQTSLLAKVLAAADAAARGNLKVAANNLKLLISQVQAQTGKKINPAVAEKIILRAGRIIADLGG